MNVTMTKILTEDHRAILALRGCAIEDCGKLGRVLRNRPGLGTTSGALLEVRRACRAALESAGHDVSDLRVGIFGEFPGC
jgi:hypothetical protein